MSKKFHDQELDKKMRFQIDKTHRGYIPINTSTDVTTDLAKVTKPNQSASYMIMKEDIAINPDIYLSGPNQWPDVLGFRDACEAYVTAMSELGRKLMRLALESIGVDDISILKSFSDPTIWLRLLHYPPQSPKAEKDLYGSAPHKDFGCLTLLAQDDVGGLQVMSPAGNWVDAPRIPGSFVVNVGDMLRRLSNGLLLSTPHRVINKSGRERYSCPFFFDPHVNTVIEPIKGTGNPIFEPLLFANFLKSELEASYQAHQVKQ
jgi:isopenicillin N synthase-like dioxygenase